MLAGIIMFGAAFRVVSDGIAGVVIACQRCEWKGQYEPGFALASDGIDDGGEPYNDSELIHMRTLEALEEAAHDHQDHVAGPTLAPVH